MNVKTVFALVLVAGWCGRAAAQPDEVQSHGQWVTNWVDAPPSLRVAQGHLYNIYISPKWQWLVLSNSFREADDGGATHAISNPDTARRMTVTTSFTNDVRDEFNITVFHYPFNPTNFVVGANGEVTAARPLRLRVLPMFAETNTASGHEVDSLMFDYGLPSTNKVPVRKFVAGN